MAESVALIGARAQAARVLVQVSNTSKRAALKVSAAANELSQNISAAVKERNAVNRRSMQHSAEAAA
eukprot:3270059-Pleurochrysis_carterae.AAC.1